MLRLLGKSLLKLQRQRKPICNLPSYARTLRHRDSDTNNCSIILRMASSDPTNIPTDKKQTTDPVDPSNSGAKIPGKETEGRTDTDAGEERGEEKGNEKGNLLKPSPKVDKLQMETEAVREAEKTQMETEAVREAEKTQMETEAVESAKEKTQIETKADGGVEGKTQMETEAVREAEKTQMETEAVREAEKTQMETEAVREAEKTQMETEAVESAKEKTQIETKADGGVEGKTQMETEADRSKAEKIQMETEAVRVEAEKTQMETEAVGGGAEKNREARDVTPPVDPSSVAEKETTENMSASQTANKLEGSQGTESQAGEEAGVKKEQPVNEVDGKKEPEKGTVGKEGNVDAQVNKETKSPAKNKSDGPNQGASSKPWPWFRSSTSEIETREYFEKMSLKDKRKYYRCGSKYKQLKDIATWPLFKTANGCTSSRTLKTPKPADPSINCKVSLWRGDITSLEIDAIVNAANTSLMGGGGVDGAIHDAAGGSLRRECMELNGCRTGEAKLSGGHKLPAKFILHTVGPIGERREQLRSCYDQCLDLVEKNKIKSIAFCCISTGIYGYPNTAAAVQALGVVRSWLESNEYAKNEMERVIFCVFLKVDYDLYSELMCLFFPTDSPDPTPILHDKQESAGKKEREEKEKTPPVKPESAASNSPPQTPTGVPHLAVSVTAPAALMRQELGAGGEDAGRGCSKEGAEGTEGAEGAKGSPEGREGAGRGADIGENRIQGEPSSGNPEERAEPNAKQPKLEEENKTPPEPIASESAASGSERAKENAPADIGEMKEPEI